MDQQAEAIYRQKGYLPPGTYRYKHRKYQYDVVFGPEVTQQAVFEGTTKPLLDGILDGYNGTVFAYGVRQSRHTKHCVSPIIGYGLRQDPHHQWNTHRPRHHLRYNGRVVPKDRGASGRL